MNTKELIKSFTKEYYQNCVNLHVHTIFSDGLGTATELIQQAKNKGYEYISITDHNTFEAYQNSNILDEKCVISGIEFDCWLSGVFFHLLAYGCDINSQLLKPYLATKKAETERNILRLLKKRDVKKLISAIHNSGGIAILAHPACYWCLNLDKFILKLTKLGLDGIETYYQYKGLHSKFKFHSEKTIEKIANKYNLIKTGGSDCHNKIFN